jgi:hypothetical protein
LTTRTAEHPVAAPAEPRQRPGWGPLLVIAHAFAVSLLALAVPTVVTAALTGLLSRS